MRLREEAAKVRAEIDRFNDDIDDLVEEFNTHQEALDRTRAAMRLTTVRLDTAQVRLDAAKRQLRRRARAAYIWNRDPISRYGQLLGVHGLHEVATAHGYQSWVINADERSVARVTFARRSLEVLSRRLEAQHDAREKLLGRLEDQREAIEDRLDQRRRYLVRLTAEIREAAEREDHSMERRRHRGVLRRLAADRRQRDRDDAGRHAAGRGRPVMTIATRALGRSVVRWALRQLGKPYRWGASGPRAFDCSGLTMRAYQAAGVRLPHSSRAQFRSGRRLHRLGDIRPGDLLFFGRSSGSINHVGLYVGNGRMVHAPYSGTRVRLTSIGRRNLIGAARPAA